MRMQKHDKLALALLYLLQLLIVFREPIGDAVQQAYAIISGSTVVGGIAIAAQHAADARVHALADGAAALPNGEHAPYAAYIEHAQPDREDGFAFRRVNNNDPETEEETKRMRRRRWREILLANLFPSFLRQSAPTQAMDGVLASSATLRIITHPAAA